MPEVLKIASLPNTVECFMMEEKGTTLPQCSQMFVNHSTEKPHTDNSKIKQCRFFGQHGHISRNCDFMAKLIITPESQNKVDIKVKKGSRKL